MYRLWRRRNLSCLVWLAREKDAAEEGQEHSQKRNEVCHSNRGRVAVLIFNFRSVSSETSPKKRKRSRSSSDERRSKKKKEKREKKERKRENKEKKHKREKSYDEDTERRNNFNSDENEDEENASSPQPKRRVEIRRVLEPEDHSDNDTSKKKVIFQKLLSGSKFLVLSRKKPFRARFSASTKRTSKFVPRKPSTSLVDTG